MGDRFVRSRADGKGPGAQRDACLWNDNSGGVDRKEWSALHASACVGRRGPRGLVSEDAASHNDQRDTTLDELGKRHQ